MTARSFGIPKRPAAAKKMRKRLGDPGHRDGVAPTFRGRNFSGGGSYGRTQTIRRASSGSGTKRRQMAARASANLAGPTGLEPATSGVTGRGSNHLDSDSSSAAASRRLITGQLASKRADLVRELVRFTSLTSSRRSGVEHSVISSLSLAAYGDQHAATPKSLFGQHRAQVRLVEDGHECRYLAVECDGEAYERREARHLQSAFQVAEVRERHSCRIAERPKRKLALLSQFAQSLAEQLCLWSDGARNSGSRHLLFRLQ